MTREELKEHCLKQIEMCEFWAIGKGEKPSGKVYEEHKLILELLEQESKLISCSERLPEPNRLVLCYITTGATKTYFLALRNEYYDDWEEGVGGSRLLGKDLGYKVLAWMPLPESFEPQESEVHDADSN